MTKIGCNPFGEKDTRVTVVTCFSDTDSMTPVRVFDRMHFLQLIASYIDFQANVLMLSFRYIYVYRWQRGKSTESQSFNSEGFCAVYFHNSFCLIHEQSMCSSTVGFTVNYEL